MRKNLSLYILFTIAMFGIGLSAKSQEQKKPSERQFSKEISKIKQIQTERNRLIEQTKTQTTTGEAATAPASIPVTVDNQKPLSTQSSATIKPSSGAMRKPQRPVTSKN